MIVQVFQVDPFTFIVAVVTGIASILILVAIYLSRRISTSSEAKEAVLRESVNKSVEVAEKAAPAERGSAVMPEKPLRPVVTVSLREGDLAGLCSSFGISELAVMSRDGLLIESFPRSSRSLLSLLPLIGDVRFLLSSAKNVYMNIKGSMILLTSLEAEGEKFYVTAKAKSEDIVTAAEVFKQLLSLYLSKRIVEIKKTAG